MRASIVMGAGALAGVLALTGCSSSSGSKAATPVTSTGSAAAGRPRCTINRPAPPAVEPVADTPGDYTLTSFDGAKIRLHWYPLDHEAPTVLMGPGWGEAGATEQSGTGLFGDTPVGNLHQDGYHVLTWDPRGFGKSTGTITVDSADAEGRDVQAIIDWIATQPNVQLDAKADPRVGMVGGSYGGGIQIVTAAIDCRVDAIVPTIAWHSLATSLDKADTVKEGWSRVLYSAAAGRQIDPHITSAYQSGIATGVIAPADRAWFIGRGPGALVKRISAPTLFIQGTVDTLFTLDEAVANYEILRARGTPTAMLWYCGGHGICLTDGGEAARTQDATTAWLRRWLQRDTTVDTGPRVEVIDQHGTRFTAADWPVPAGPPLAASGSGTLNLTADGGSGPAVVPTGSKNPIDAVAAGITPAKAANALSLPVRSTRAALAVGAPTLRLSYSGTVPDGDRPTRVFAQLVDDTTGLVLGNQATPIPVTLDGRPHHVTVPLEMIGHSFAAGASVTLQVVATTVSYAQPRLGGTVTFSKVAVSLPTARDLAEVR
ncbi:MAG: alpha/beta fold hydrolase [Acidimicrobiia bacterium]